MRLINGDCLDRMKELDDCSVDSIVTDPPYGLGFMGKHWDKGVPSVEFWVEMLRVLKPGGYLLAFSGTRTYHRMATAIEDGGFEIRDMIEWVYGCLSEDTEILTKDGYKPLRKLTQYDKICVYDIENNIYKWERPQRYSVYKVHQDTAYRIKSDYTDQIVSRNHRCLVEREGKLVFVEAWQLNEVEYMPTLSDDFYSLQENSNRKLLLKELLRKGKGLAQTVFSKWKGDKKSEERIEVRKEPSLERWSNLLEEERKLQADKICEVSEGVFTDGKKRWICNGASFDSGSILGDMFREATSYTSYQSRPTGQPTGKPDVISIKQGTQITRRARVEKIEYSGIIFCPTVSTGAFVARRNGQVFITGNSGFPKSHNIGKAVDKLQGNEREVVGEQKALGNARGKGAAGHYANGISSLTNGEYEIVKESWKIDKGTSEWEGWGTALKPAHEPICMARKPLSEKTVAKNVLKHGTGGINVDVSRVESNEENRRSVGGFASKSKIFHNDEKYKINTMETNEPQGRFPANLIHDNSEEVRECFPDTKGVSKGTRGSKKSIGQLQSDGGWGTKNTGEEVGFGDSGNASRFFKSIIYQAKASKSERNKGCEGLEDKLMPGTEFRPSYLERFDTTGDKGSPRARFGKMTNNHPTVKPIALMEYLIEMVTPEGGTVLDPFMGSGTTGVACKNLNRDFVGIELDSEYFKIAENRINGTN